ncbi:PrgI family protein [Subdoligranulum sp. OF01-18]|uniref:PrgI family protein n=1 Tax=Ruthenibacterium lactatiformans TaxID=1550024 RepID=UPI000E736BAC|nr:PrgI family protein [Ruthenibacterium lactatiformans]MDU5534217.1 PrgI family protein [Oscillospiraceae bacterium]RJW81215.1 PrgI family protein [Subdoligranulum sp. OF01-18]
MEIKIPKEIREYQESIFFGLNTRQFVCSLLALGVAVGLYFLLRDTAGTEIAGWACMLGAAPFAACGFVRYHGMTAEQLLWAIIKSELLTPHRLVFRAENFYYTAMRAKIEAGQRRPKREAEVRR